MTTIDKNKLSKLRNTSKMLDEKYGERGTGSR
jgi:hypothetical protein